MMHAARAIQRLLRRAMRPAVPAAFVSPDPIIRLPSTHIEAAARLVDRAALESRAFFRRRSSVSDEGVDREFLDFVRALCRELNKRRMPFFAIQFVRSAAEQDQLYKMGRTRAKAGQSPHNFGMAADIVHYDRFWNLTSKEWAVIGLIGKEVARKRNLKVTWGGDWNFYDPAHWERADWKKLAGKAL